MATRVTHLASQHRADDARIFLKECRSLARAGYDVHLVAPDVADHVEDDIVVHGFAQPVGYRPVRVALRVWRVWRAARSVRPDLCHFHEPVLLLVALLFKVRGARIVYDVHELHLNTLEYAPRGGRTKELGLRLLEAMARHTCDGFVAATGSIAQHWPRDRTVEVRNYALPEEFPDSSSDVGGSDLVYVGIITRARGLIEMVEAVRLLRHRQARLVLIGRFETPELEREARSLPGWSRVEYLGWLGRRELGERLSAARAGLVVFHPERNHIDALPNKLFEYMAAGLPLIASDFASWRGLLDPVGCATFVDPLDPNQIADAIDELLADEGRASEMGRHGAAAVRERLNWHREAGKLVELYTRLGMTPSRG